MNRKLIFSIIVALTSPNALAIGHLASIDLFDRTEQRALPVYWHQGNAYVVDFGIAKLSAPAETDREAATIIQSTSPGMIIGTARAPSAQRKEGN